MAFLTVGITYHNEGELLTDCLKSFCEAPEKPDEIIVFDDASTLKPEAFIPSGYPVRVIRSEKNLGPGKGRNLILDAAKGEWIHFHDCDDWVAADWLTKIKDKMHPDCDLVLTEISSYQEGRLLSSQVIGLPECLDKVQLLKFAIRNFILIPSGTFRTALARRIQGFRESLWQSEDWDFYVRLINSSRSWEYIPESLSSIRIREKSRSQKKAETLTCVLQAILFLQKELEPVCRIELADKASWVGSKLYQLGEKATAREAFSVAASLGPARFSHQKAAFRWIAEHFGQEAAEKVSGVYRQLIPQKLRAYLVHEVS